MKNAQIYTFLNAVLTAWKAKGTPSGIDAYLRITQLVEALPEETEFANLKTLITPIIVTSPQQQADFYETFDRVLTNFDVGAPPSVSEPVLWKKVLKWAALGLLAFIMAWLVWQFLKPKPTDVATETLKPFSNVVVVDLKKDAEGRSMSIKDNLKLIDSSLVIQSMSDISATKEHKFASIHIDTVQKTLFYKPIAIGDDTFEINICLTNGTCDTLNYIFKVQENVSSGSTGGGWDDGLTTKNYNHQPKIETLVPKLETKLSFRNAYMSGWKWLILLLVAGFLRAIYYILKVREEQKQEEKQAEQNASNLERKPNTAAPFIWQIQIEGTQKVNFDAIFARFTQQLRRRSEIEHLIFDAKRTIKATIAKGGLATFRYRQPTRADEYLFLIDVHNANDHRAQVFDLLYRTLDHSEVLIERFFYDGDIRLCWNEAHRHGIRLNELAHRLGTSRLVVVGTAASLMNPQAHELMGWTSVFDAWRQRVLLTPRAPMEWNAMERQLATKFRILPANLKGLAALSDTFDALDAPDFRRWRSDKDPENAPINLPDKLSGAAIMAQLTAEFTVYKNGKTDTRLLQWLAACAVPPVLHWDTTLFFGNLIAEYYGKNGDEMGLVNLDNLFKINRLSWFLEGKLPHTARLAMLDFLEKTHPSVLTQVRTAWDKVLQDNLAAARKAAEERGEDFDASVAFDDLRLQMIINELKQGITDENKRQNLMTELRSLSRGVGKGDIVALEILEKEQTNSKKSLENIKKELHIRIDKGEIDTAINELLDLTKAQTTLQTRLKEMKLELRK